jgi:hypothetical protein
MNICFCSLLKTFFLDIFFICISNAISKVPYTLSPTLLPNPPIPASWPWNSPLLGHIIFAKPRASTPIDDLLGKTLLYIQLKIQALGSTG